MPEAVTAQSGHVRAEPDGPGPEGIEKGLLQVSAVDDSQVAGDVGRGGLQPAPIWTSLAASQLGDACARDGADLLTDPETVECPEPVTEHGQPRAGRGRGIRAFQDDDVCPVPLQTARCR
jgi:hypothetical protein